MNYEYELMAQFFLEEDELWKHLKCGDLDLIKRYLAAWDASDMPDWITIWLALDTIRRSDDPEWRAWHKSFLVKPNAVLPLERLLIAMDMYQDMDWVHEMLGYYPEIRENMMDPTSEDHKSVLGTALDTWNWDFVMAMVPLLRRDDKPLVIDARVIQHWKCESILSYESGLIFGRRLNDHSPFLSLDSVPQFQIQWEDFPRIITHYPDHCHLLLAKKVVDVNPRFLFPHLLKIICKTSCDHAEDMIQLVRKYYPDLTLADLFEPGSEWLRDHTRRNYAEAGDIICAWENILRKLFTWVTIVCDYQQVIIVGYYEDLPGFYLVKPGVYVKGNNEICERVVRCAIEKHMALHPRAKSARK